MIGIITKPKVFTSHYLSGKKDRQQTDGCLPSKSIRQKIEKQLINGKKFVSKHSVQGIVPV